MRALLSITLLAASLAPTLADPASDARWYRRTIEQSRSSACGAIGERNLRWACRAEIGRRESLCLGLKDAAEREMCRAWAR
jgi:hypothetical protein